MKKHIGFCFFLLVFLVTSCKESNKQQFDFTIFEEANFTSPAKKKFLTYINTSGNRFDTFEMIDHMYFPGLSQYMDSPDVDILFLVYAEKDNLNAVKEYLETWRFGKYIVHDKEKWPFNNKVYGISYIYDKCGKEIALTNPSVPGFHKLMKN
jgi:hypothetical protein